MAVSIVNKGIRSNILSQHKPKGLKNSGWKVQRMSLGHGNEFTLEIYGKSILVIGEQLARIQEHFGTNRSRAMRIAIHLTDAAIRKNKARVEV